MNKICTNIKESKRLIELGIDLNTADMHYMYRPWEIDEDTIGSQTDACIGCDISFYYGADNGKTYHYIPAWSLADLLDVIPKEVKIKGQRYAPCLFPIIDGHWLYKLWYNSNEIIESPIAVWHDNPVDAAYEMIIKLNELKML